MPPRAYVPVTPSQRVPQPPKLVIGRTQLGFNAGVLAPVTFRRPKVGTAWALAGISLTGLGGLAPARGVVWTADVILDGQRVDSFDLTAADGVTPTALQNGGTEYHPYVSPFPIYDTTELQLGLSDYGDGGHPTLYIFSARAQVNYL